MPTPNSNDRPKAVAADCAPTRKYRQNSTATDDRNRTGPIGDRDPMRFLMDELAARGMTFVYLVDSDEAEGVKR